MSRVRLGDQLKALQQREKQLQADLAELKRARRELLLRHALLATWCDSLSLVQLQMAVQRPVPEEMTPEPWQKELLQQEVRLLQQLTTSEGPAVPQPKMESLVQPEANTISPCTDPMQYFNRILCTTSPHDTEHMSAEDLAAEMRRTISTISIKLHQLKGLAPWEQPNMLEQVADVWDRYMRKMCSLVTYGRADIVEGAYALNLETLKADPAASSFQASQAAVLVPLLGLSEQQQEIICVGMRLFHDLLSTIYKERQQLQAQMTAVQEAEACESNKGDPGAAREAGSSAGSGSSGFLGNLHGRQQLLLQQQALTSHLELLLAKEYMLRGAGMGWFIGCLTYEQLSRSAVMCWPYHFRMLYLATEIMQQRERLVKQRLQLAG